MKTVLVVTFHRAFNYGGVLQAYATQQLFGRTGCRMSFIDYRPPRTDQMGPRARWNRNPLTRGVWWMLKQANFRRLESVFGSFAAAHFSVTHQHYDSLEELRRQPPVADIYCTGSDQTWNRDITRSSEDVYCLRFLPEGATRISFAASFGRSQLDGEEMASMAPVLGQYAAISVRERTGLDLLSAMGIRDATCLVDPTLALDAREWSGVIAGRQRREKYVLIYQLNSNPEFDRYAREFARRAGLPLFRVSVAYNHVLRSGRLVYAPPVGEWLSWMMHAEFILTDAFHGVAFAINFSRPFICVLPQERSARIENLLELTGLNHRVLTDWSDFPAFHAGIDYAPVQAVLKLERAKVADFLEDAVGG